MIRRLIIVVMLLAMPLQSFAAAWLLPCAGVAQATAAVAVAMDQHAHHGHHQDHDGLHAMPSPDGHGGDHHKPAHSAGLCSPCCMSALMTAPFAPMPPPAGAAAFIPAPGDALTSVILAGPQRPPTPSFA